MNALEIQGLTKLYKNGRGITDLNMEIPAGEIYGFLGPNGAGKTTAMKCITGLIHPDAGKIRIFGKDMETEYEAGMRMVGAIIESCEAYEYLSARKNMELAARYYGAVDSGRIDKVLEMVGLKEVQKEKVSVFSLGMKQRLGLGIAMLHRPKLLILDEPGNGLDIEGIVEIRNIIRTLAEEEKATFLISSHQINEIQQLCSRIGIIREGRMLRNVDLVVQEEEMSLEEVYLEEIRKGKVS